MSGKEVREHLKHLKLEGRAKLTVYHRERALIRLAAALPVPLLEADADMLYDWRASLTGGDGHVACEISHVKMFYRWAAGRDLIAVSPAEELPVPKVPRRLPRPIAEAELAHALDAAGARVRIWLVLAAWAGLRACEIAALRTECVRLDDAPPVILVAGKGGTERIVHLCDFAVAELRAAGLPPRGLCWTGAHGQQLRPWWVSKLCNELLHQEGIASTLHKLRARFATALYTASGDILLVRDEMGHASVQTTEIYTLHAKAGARRAVNKLPVPARRLRRVS
jgi:site-specific recombinase XerC